MRNKNIDGFGQVRAFFLISENQKQREDRRYRSFDLGKTQHHQINLGVGGIGFLCSPEGELSEVRIFLKTNKSANASLQSQYG